MCAKKAAAKKRSAKENVTPDQLKRTAVSDKGSTTSGQPPSLKNWFAGQTFCLTGRFNYPVDSNDLKKLLQTLGGKVVDKVDDTLNFLLVGEGKATTKQTKAEALNASGAATIEIVDELIDLFRGLAADLPDFLCDPTQIQSLVEFLDPAWIHRDEQFALKGVDFRGKSIDGGQKGASLKLQPMNCDFSGATLTNTHFLTTYSDSQFSKCRFVGTKFNNASMSHSWHNTFEAFIGNLDIRYVHDSIFRNAKCEVFSTNSLNGSELAGLNIGLMEGRMDKVEWLRNQISDCSIATIKALEFCAVNCKIDSLHIGTIVSSDQQQALPEVLFEKCKLTKCTFEASKLSILRFDHCELTDCTFKGIEAGQLDLSGSQLKSVRFEECSFVIASATPEQLKGVRGLDEADLALPSKLKSAKELATAIEKSAKFQVTFAGTTGDGRKITLSISREWRADFQYAGVGKAKSHQASRSFSCWSGSLKPNDFFQAVVWLLRQSGIEGVDLSSIKAKTSKCPLKPKDIKQAIADAVFESAGKQPVSEEELKHAAAEAKKSKATIKAAVINELTNSNVKALKKRSQHSIADAGPYRKLSLAGVRLPGLALSDTNLGACDLSGADLSKASLKSCNLSKTNFSGANLTKANLSHSNLTEADFSNANLSGAILSQATFRGTNFSGAKLVGARIIGSHSYEKSTNLCGVDFSGADCTDASMKGCFYDEKTLFPLGFTTDQMKEMQWLGGGVPPHERKQNKAAAGPIDFDQFMKRLTEITDASRLTKSLKMLKADRFELFCEVESESVTGVIRSQSDASLVYSCHLDSSGGFACCTQNLNPCGGLRGAVCKHILVLVIGLAQNQQVDLGEIDEWVNRSKIKSPNLDKDPMSSVLLKYKGAEAGEIDWRPTETVPEDFMAY